MISLILTSEFFNEIIINFVVYFDFENAPRTFTVEHKKAPGQKQIQERASSFGVVTLVLFCHRWMYTNTTAWKLWTGFVHRDFTFVCVLKPRSYFSQKNCKKVICIALLF